MIFEVTHFIDTENIQNDMVDREAFNKLWQNIDQDNRVLRNRIDGLELDLRKTDSFIEYRAPLDTYLAVGEILDYTLSTKPSKMKLEHYMKYKLKEQIDKGN